jgi:predicted ATPase
MNTCNRYLVDKSIHYDEAEYSITIRQGDQTIELAALSSGEKQIVSLFSHLFLQSGTDFIIIIDEPELSLSTPWQKTFLPDIIASGRCDFLVAVTHSPFIFDNDLRPYASDLRRYIADASDE